ncbi:hypothetical protein RJ639_033561 [Escallonia herrerae]|uniref:Uncharacterized protein n=1 Tax=Escallonia herrerae TaxID=1293975 RepID=A0AA89BK23_9ASTE|nr:hypothetical protein RJ639_046945 [Escallonia herrerae]KAK3034606.1 hypothetical protein RJ639_033561 [Escallonia herrerae]
MDSQLQATIFPSLRVKATLRLGSEVYPVHAKEGILSEQLVSMKCESMSILKDFITKHNVPNDVPDELSSGDDGEVTEKPPVKCPTSLVPSSSTLWAVHMGFLSYFLLCLDVRVCTNSELPRLASPLPKLAAITSELLKPSSL